MASIWFHENIYSYGRVFYDDQRGCWFHVYNVFGTDVACVGQFSTYVWHQTPNDKVHRLELGTGGAATRIVYPNYIYGEDFLTGITDALHYGRWVTSTSIGFQLTDEQGTSFAFPPGSIEAVSGNTPEEANQDYRRKAEAREKARQDAEDERIEAEAAKQALNQALDNSQKKKLEEEKKRQANEARALKTLAQLLMAKHAAQGGRYHRDSQPKGKTKCNFFVADFAEAFLDGLKLPELFDKNGNPRVATDMLEQLRNATNAPPGGPSQTPKWINARDFLETQFRKPTGTNLTRRLDVYEELLRIGWEKSKEGKIVVVAMEGHVGIIMPYEKRVNGQNSWQNRPVPPVAQAGKTNNAETNIALGFGKPENIGIDSGREPTDNKAPLGVFVFELWTPKFVVVQKPRPAWEVTVANDWKNMFSSAKNDVNSAIQQVGNEIGKLFGI